ncbi:hypothetical protein HanPSC8_Chr16g0742321 [Helianthus annuus]|nr:hypothetical protein HanPSC8_Chr16g0742321 [Helianthus annuus]
MYGLSWVVLVGFVIIFKYSCGRETHKLDVKEHVSNLEMIRIFVIGIGHFGFT